MARNDPQVSDGAVDGDLVTSLLNREIYTLSGLFVGEIHDVRIDFDALEVSHVVVENINPDAFALQNGKDGILVPYRFVRSVGDVVLINEIGPRETDEDRSRQARPADD